MAGTDCLFCRIATREIQSDIVAEHDGLLAIKDINPQAPVHLLIIPTEHIASLAEVSPAHTPLLGEALQFANRLAREHHVTDEGYRVVVNCGAGAGQTVFHLHLHLLGGRPMRWPPG